MEGQGLAKQQRPRVLVNICDMYSLPTHSKKRFEASRMLYKSLTEPQWKSMDFLHLNW